MTDADDTVSAPVSATPSQASAAPPSQNAGSPAAADKKPKKDENFLSFLFWLVLGVVVLRSFIISPFNIPSESMLPRLLDGDYLFATKWSYGYSKYSLPFSLPLIPGRIFAHQPERGDVAIFKAPPGNDVDYIKRVIGLPGDEIQMRHGQLYINGTAVPKVRVADFVLPVTPNTHCYAPEFEGKDAKGNPVCNYPQFRETLPNGKSYNVLDLLQTPQDDTGVYVVPEGHLFMMGDNRDNSMDSRFPAVEGEGVGMVPEANLVGKASLMMFSTDGSSKWYEPWTWFTAARWSRIGGTF
ncbi:signal peptidase I [Novosphingobium sp. 9]|uniref:signal peptidase I n=1 Tax=Novosphingobium sp. 9 TaxID=2025349 RepID=UPI0021B6966F|nr:signal peptidase I [Novosphingobium sp. 9]